eukprot:1398073-Rhodomonas_salina.2
MTSNIRASRPRVCSLTPASVQPIRASRPRVCSLTPASVQPPLHTCRHTRVQPPLHTCRHTLRIR